MKRKAKDLTSRQKQHITERKQTNEAAGRERIRIYASDATERKRAEEALRKSEEKYRTLVEGLHEGIWAIDKGGYTTFANARMAEMLGYSVEEMQGKHLFSFMDERGVEIAKRLLERRKAGVREVHEFEFLRKDGSRIYAALATSPVTDESGNYIGALAGVIDLTERKRMEEELRRYSTQLEGLVAERTGKLTESERRFRELADLLPQIVFETDETGKVTFGNQTGFAITGYAQEDLERGLNALQLFAPEERARVRDKIARVLGGERSSGTEYRMQRKDGGTFPVIIHTAAALREGKAVGLRGIGIDITERKRLEAELAKSQRLAAIGETAAMVGHDLRNPLQGIAGALYLLKQESLTAEERNELIQLIQHNVDYSDAIIRDLSEYSTEIRLKLVETTPKSITRDAVRAVEIPGNITVQNLSEEHPTIRVDPDKMRRISINLIENAIEAMPQGGTLTISSKQSNGDVEIALSDTGSGMPERVMENLWKPLQTTKAKGLGLGLAICKRITDAHGGTINVKSKTGEGTTVTIRLPIKPNAAEVKQK